MIHYQLQCHQGHAFDGWFKDSASFDDQAKAGFVNCPGCNSTEVTRALMAPSLGRGTKKFETTAPKIEPPRADNRDSLPVAATGPTAAAIAENGLPDNVRALLQRLRSEVERSCDYVGAEFAEEARRIHYGETDPHGIYGEATATEAEALAEEGIDIGVLPWLPRSDS
ncbi:DUF1178 family protein [Acidisoma cellulosilytica]|uniref:DUF1178 family protein n=1 Tax=Acidisoma cellulosilyticum TaxID=2802395 RepID=A0A963Z2W1_9PROT|nr:DUF1178 family protein [Acidisoma cellulosilyticum]MCB8880880.1 DUF1178 family protein [Acidisoma cellulosilyticum]